MPAPTLPEGGTTAPGPLPIRAWAEPPGEALPHPFRESAALRAQEGLAGVSVLKSDPGSRGSETGQLTPLRPRLHSALLTGLPEALAGKRGPPVSGGS